MGNVQSALPYPGHRAALPPWEGCETKRIVLHFELQLYGFLAFVNFSVENCFTNLNRTKKNAMERKTQLDLLSGGALLPTL